jgi:hypothetical protein
VTPNLRSLQAGIGSHDQFWEKCVPSSARALGDQQVRGMDEEPRKFLTSFKH